jgi:hypothetical protein
MCKACYKVYNRESRTIECKSCGREMYKNNGYKVCYECRDTEYHHDRPVCDSCTFLATCRVRVRSKDEQYWDWLPPCFKQSAYHEAYQEAMA